MGENAKQLKLEKLSEKIIDIGFIIYISSLIISKAGLNIGLSFMIVGFLINLKENIRKILEMPRTYKVIVIFFVIYSFYDLITPGYIKSFSREIGELYRILPLVIVPLYKKSEINIGKYIEIMIAAFSLATTYNLLSYDSEKMERLNGFLYPTTTGHISAIILVFIFGLFINEKRRTKRIYYLLTLVLGSYMLFLTATRAAILGFLFTSILLSVLKYKKRSIIIIFIITAFSLVMINKISYLNNFKPRDILKEVSLNTRFKMWEVSLKALREENNFYLGLGRDRLLDVFKKEREMNPQTLIESKYAGNPHSSYITILSEKGLYMFLLFIGIFIVKILVSTFYLKESNFFYSLLGGQIVYFISGLTEDNWRSLLMRAPYFVILIFLFLIKNSKGQMENDKKNMEKNIIE